MDNPLFARFFDWCGGRNEERGNREPRRELLAGLSGRVIEIGAGNGLNFPHYPVSVREVVAVEPEQDLRARAVRAATDAPIPVRVADGTAAELPAAEAEFDAVVVSGLLCSVADVPAALAEFMSCPAPDQGGHQRGIHRPGVPRLPVPGVRGLLPGRPPHYRRRPQNGQPGWAAVSVAQPGRYWKPVGVRGV